MLSNELDIPRTDLYKPIHDLKEENKIRMLGKGECKYYNKKHKKYTRWGNPKHTPRGKLANMSDKQRFFLKLVRNFSINEEFNINDIRNIKTVKDGEEFNIYKLAKRQDAVKQSGKKDGKKAFKIVSKEYNYEKDKDVEETEKETEFIPTMDSVRKMIEENYDEGDEFTTSEFMDKLGIEEKREETAQKVWQLNSKNDTVKKMGKKEGNENLYKVTSKWEEQKEEETEKSMRKTRILFNKLKEEFGIGNKFTSKDIKKKFGKEARKRTYDVSQWSDGLKKVGKKKLKGKKRKVNVYKVVSENYMDKDKKEETEGREKIEPTENISKELEEMKRQIKKLEEDIKVNEKRINGKKIKDQRKKKETIKPSQDNKIIIRTLYKQMKVLEELVSD